MNKNEKRIVYILFGKRAARLYSEGGIESILSEGDSLDMQIIERHFSTDAEFQAYLHGIEDSQGWEDFVVMDNAELFDKAHQYVTMHN